MITHHETTQQQEQIQAITIKHKVAKRQEQHQQQVTTKQPKMQKLTTVATHTNAKQATSKTPGHQATSQKKPTSHQQANNK